MMSLLQDVNDAANIVAAKTNKLFVFMFVMFKVNNVFQRKETIK